MDFLVLWVDDDWGTPDAGWRLEQLLEELTEELGKRNIVIRVERRNTGAILDDITSRQYDLVILDYELSTSSHNKVIPASSFDVLARLAHMKKTPPVVIVTRYVERSLWGSGDYAGVQCVRAFEKNTRGIGALCDFIHDIVERPPVSAVILSDLHAGFLTTREAKVACSYKESLINDLREIQSEHKVEYLLMPGDLAWKHQQADLIEGSTLIASIRNALGITHAFQWHFCPGNHDVNLLDRSNPWGAYQEFVMRCGAGEPDLLRRFYAYNVRAQRLNAFHDRRSTLAVAAGKNQSVLFAALNSCKVNHESNQVVPEVGEAQWNALETLVGREPSNQLRIALVHHPLLAAPGGDEYDERPLWDQGRALHRLGKLKFGLIIHGHAHFSAIYEHRVSVLNRAGSSNEPTRLVVIACPTGGGEPLPGTPFRQYLIMHLNHADPDTSCRTLQIRSRVYSQVDNSWSDGDYLEKRQYTVICKA